jgi:hypothetical protein
VQIKFENCDRLLPKVFIKDDIFNDLYLSWKDLLVIKLLGKKIGFYQLNTRLKNLWKLTGGFELMDVANGFFMVKFGLEMDKTKVINEGPWTVFDHHLAVSH